jgi:hypothetical protein
LNHGKHGKSTEGSEPGLRVAGHIDRAAGAIRSDPGRLAKTHG